MAAIAEISFGIWPLPVQFDSNALQNDTKYPENDIAQFIDILQNIKDQIACQSTLTTASDAYFQLIPEAAVSSNQIDFWILLCQGLPVAIVLQTSDDAIDHYAVMDSMRRIRAYHCRGPLFAILISKDGSIRFAWPSDTHFIASLCANNFEKSDFKLDNIQLVEIETSVDPLRSRASIQRIYCLLLKNLRVIELNLIEAPLPFNQPQPYMTIRSSCETIIWSYRQMKLTVESPKKISRRSGFEIVLLKDLHGGRDGRVWLAALADVSHDGFCCIFPRTSLDHLVAVKFSCCQELTEEDQLFVSRREAKAWLDLVGFGETRRVLGNCIVVVMPFALSFVTQQGIPELKTTTSILESTVYSFDASSSSTLCASSVVLRQEDYDYVKHLNNLVVYSQRWNIKEALENAMKEISKAGIQHEDLNWRHLCFIPVIKYSRLVSVQPMLLDLSRIKENVGEAEAFAKMQSASNAMLRNLAMSPLSS